MKRAILLLTFVAYSMIDPSAAAAAPAACMDRDIALAHLSRAYKEVPIAVGLSNTGELIEVLASEDGSTWTLLVTAPDKTTCPLAAGEHWRPVERVEPQGPAL